MEIFVLLVVHFLLPLGVGLILLYVEQRLKKK